MNSTSMIPPSYYDPDPDAVSEHDIDRALQRAMSRHSNLYAMALAAVRPLQPPAVHAALRLSQVVGRYYDSHERGDEALRGLAAEAVCNKYLEEN